MGRKVTERNRLGSTVRSKHIQIKPKEITLFWWFPWFCSIFASGYLRNRWTDFSSIILKILEIFWIFQKNWIFAIFCNIGGVMLNSTHTTFENPRTTIWGATYGPIGSGSENFREKPKIFLRSPRHLKKIYTRFCHEISILRRYLILKIRNFRISWFSGFSVDFWGFWPNFAPRYLRRYWIFFHETPAIRKSSTSRKSLVFQKTDFG